MPLELAGLTMPPRQGSHSDSRTVNTQYTQWGCKSPHSKNPGLNSQRNSLEGILVTGICDTIYTMDLALQLCLLESAVFKLLKHTVTNTKYILS